MRWTDEGIVLGLRGHGEGGAVLEVLTRAHGRHLGYVHGARSKRLAAALQPGATVSLGWSARLDEQLGTFAVEPVASRAGALIGSAMALYGLATMTALVRRLPERDPHPGLFDAVEALVSRLDDPALAPPLFVAFELAMLAELGFGLDLEACAATGRRDDLAFVSPRTGRAVSREAGLPYAEKLLALPPFLTPQGRDRAPDARELADGFALAAFFLDRHVWKEDGEGPPPERARFVAKALAERA